MSSSATDQTFHSSAEVVARLRPSYPVLCLRPAILQRNAQRFMTLFPGRVMYAVKCNPHPLVVRSLYAAGIRDFDTASLGEIGQVLENHPDATCYYMHPVKARAAIKMARTAYGLEFFAIDHRAELDKILSELTADGIGIVVRIRTATTGDSVYELSAKFGCEIAVAAELLRIARAAGCKTGVSFHVGSQCKNPQAFIDGLARVEAVIRESGIMPSMIDVGGGFPARYPGSAVPPLTEYMTAIQAGLATLSLPVATQVFCEPGRALVADACSLIVQVLLRKDERLYINDGIYGCLSEMFLSKLRMPVTLIGRAADSSRPLAAYTLFGPTCDSLDVIPGTFPLPADIQEGDWLEIHQLGAYSNALATHFNGFYPDTMVLVEN